ncbi:MAG: LLM class flavin-dependent oxidoreductase [Chloroflexi bacterium]|nr:LLM class flavin-dependent oxidoreductase [Chloroflexota bacterium]MYJ91786.1 LLM class flavin-dependent oxidoreductase [Chloroflexota bacterium]
MGSIAVRFGLFLTNGLFDGIDDSAALQLSLDSAQLAESLGYEHLWVAEHHFMDASVCSSALTLAAFLLGWTERIRVGTAVVLAPLVHPITLAEQVAILDQVSGGRLDLGLGRGGYSLDYDVFAVPTERWTEGVEPSVAAVVDALSNATVSCENSLFPYESVSVRPRPQTQPHPPVYVATGTAEAVEVAARLRLPLQFYFYADTESRVQTIQQYRGFAQKHGWDGDVDHLHVIPCLVEDDEASARERMSAGMISWLNSGNHPRLNDPELDLETRALQLADFAPQVIDQSPIGPPDVVIEWLEAFHRATGARNIALHMEPLGDSDGTLRSIRRFASDVAPHLRISGRRDRPIEDTTHRF